MDVEVEMRFKAIEDRLTEVQAAQREQANSARGFFGLVKIMEENIVQRLAALETNFSLVNAAVHKLTLQGADNGKKLDQVLDLSQRRTGSRAN